jgi:hypothetical protein
MAIPAFSAHGWDRLSSLTFLFVLFSSIGRISGQYLEWAIPYIIFGTALLLTDFIILTVDTITHSCAMKKQLTIMITNGGREEHWN